MVLFAIHTLGSVCHSKKIVLDVHIHMKEYRNSKELQPYTSLKRFKNDTEVWHSCVNMFQHNLVSIHLFPASVHQPVCKKSNSARAG